MKEYSQALVNYYHDIRKMTGPTTPFIVKDTLGNRQFVEDMNDPYLFVKGGSFQICELVLRACGHTQNKNTY